jgi:hypothetical protein
MNFAWNAAQHAKLDEIGVNFLTCVAALAFGVLGFSGAVEILKASLKHDEERRYLSSIAMFSLLVIAAALGPIAISDQFAPIVWSSLAFASFAFLLFVHAIYEVITGKVTVQFRLISFVLFPATLLAILAVAANGVLWGSFTIYKGVMLWALLVLCIRFFLFMRHLTMRADARAGT